VRRLVGILGGCFDPVHYGHLKPAAEIQQRLALDELRIVPCYKPVHRPAPVADAEQRLHMLRLALQEFPQFNLDEREIQRGGDSYTFDTLSELRRDYPQDTLCLLLGADALQGFTQWHRWQQILEMAHLIIGARPGYELIPGSVTAQLLGRYGLQADDELRTRPAGGIRPVSIVQYDISSTAIRERLRNGQSIVGLVPPALAQWLANNPIYKSH
jgi:nicotinate-nucleotide adenylyltransferase